MKILKYWMYNNDIVKENIVGNGTYETQNEIVRKFVCRTCGKSFNSRSGTVFHDLRTNKDTFILGLKMVLNDIPLRKISYVLDIKLDTIREWLLRAANHSEKVNEIFLKDLKISKVELDELWTFVKKNQFREWQVRRKSGGFG